MKLTSSYIKTIVKVNKMVNFIHIMLFLLGLTLPLGIIQFFYDDIFRALFFSFWISGLILFFLSMYMYFEREEYELLGFKILRLFCNKNVNQTIDQIFHFGRNATSDIIQLGLKETTINEYKSFNNRYQDQIRYIAYLAYGYRKYAKPFSDYGAGVFLETSFRKSDIPFEFYPHWMVNLKVKKNIQTEHSANNSQSHTYK